MQSVRLYCLFSVHNKPLVVIYISASNQSYSLRKQKYNFTATKQIFVVLISTRHSLYWRWLMFVCNFEFYYFGKSDYKGFANINSSFYKMLKKTVNNLLRYVILHADSRHFYPISFDVHTRNVFKTYSV